jgi:hypothetical protein
MDNYGWFSMITLNRERVTACLMLAVVFILAQPIMMQTFAAPIVNYGNQNIEQYPDIIGGGFVQAYVKITITHPTLIQSVSLLLQYSGSDGSQCIKFGIYKDNGFGSPVGQPLVAATQKGYCLYATPSWGPNWQTWNLAASDYLAINLTGDYWICTLALQTYGTIYHYAYTGGYDYTYGYADFFFPTPYETGFPMTFSLHPTWETYAPFSFYVTGVTATW